MEATGILQEEQELRRKAQDFSKQLDFKSDNRPDLIWLEKAMGVEHAPEPDFKDRMEQIQQLSVQVLEKCDDYIPAEDRASILEDLGEWDPRDSNFLRAYPEVVDAIHDRDIHIEKEAHIIGYIKTTEGVEGVQSTLGMEVSHKSVCALIDEKNLWRKRSNPEILDSTTRPDFEYLKSALKLEGKEGFEGYTNARQLHSMGYKYISQRTHENALGAGLRAGVDGWDPTKSFFHEEIVETIGNLSTRGTLNKKELEQAEVMMSPGSITSKKALLEMQRESSLDLELIKKSNPDVSELQMDLL